MENDTFLQMIYGHFPWVRLPHGTMMYCNLGSQVIPGIKPSLKLRLSPPPSEVDSEPEFSDDDAERPPSLRSFVSFLTVLTR